jgi:hypothetical protein
MSQLETRAAVQERLRAEGRWDEALAFRESLKKQGVSPAEANRQMLERFPRLPATNGPAAAQTNGAPAPPPVKRRRRGKRGRMDLKADVTFCYLNIDQDPDSVVAPNAGAKEMLKFARANPTRFFTTFVAKLLPRGEEASDPSAGPKPSEEDEDAALEFVRRMAEKYASKPKEEEADSPPPAVVPVQPPPQPEPPPAPPPAQPLLCQWCEQHGPQEGCMACMDLQQRFEGHRARA